MRRLEPPRPVHGGEGVRAGARFGISAEAVLDFSVNVNPLGTPQCVLDLFGDGHVTARALAQYPDREATRFVRAVRERHAIPLERIIVGNGSAALIDAALRVIGPSRCVVPVPAFSEYRRAVVAAGHEWVPIALSSDHNFGIDVAATIGTVRATRPGAVLINNPHNPSGSLLSREGVLEIAQAAAAIGSLVVVDEAFIDYAPAESVIHDVEAIPNTIVLRSVTKFYAMPALRIGYAVAIPELARRVAAYLPSWPVTTIAAEAAALAMQDAAFERHSLIENTWLRSDLTSRLRALGIRVLPSSANFLLLELPASWGTRKAICEELLRNHGIAVRNCEDYEGLEERPFVRVAVKDVASNARLVHACRVLSENNGGLSC